jgi:hypothetical protein
MNQDVYYNEPGCERYKGTERGELLNIGYSNIVRFSNLKYAMVE